MFAGLLIARPGQSGGGLTFFFGGEPRASTVSRKQCLPQLHNRSASAFTSDIAIILVQTKCASTRTTRRSKVAKL